MKLSNNSLFNLFTCEECLKLILIKQKILTQKKVIVYLALLYTALTIIIIKAGEWVKLKGREGVVVVSCSCSMAIWSRIYEWIWIMILLRYSVQFIIITIICS